MKKISYGQNSEDVTLYRLLQGAPSGFYIDVGANDPLVYSVTKHFYDRGWHGINVEPIPSLWMRLQEDRPRDVNLNLGLSNVEGTLEFFENPGALGVLSTFSRSQAEVYRQSGVNLVQSAIPVTTLAAVCEQHTPAQIDFLSIDVEGYERAVLEGGDWKRFRPRVVVLEAVAPKTKEPSQGLWEDILFGADYLFATADRLNRYYVRAEDRPLIEAFPSTASWVSEFEQHPYVRMLAEGHAALERIYQKHNKLKAETKDSVAELTASKEQVAKACTLIAAFHGSEEFQRATWLRPKKGLPKFESGPNGELDLPGDVAALIKSLRKAVIEVERLSAQLGDLGPRSLNVARALHRLSQRYPRVASIARRLTG